MYMGFISTFLRAMLMFIASLLTIFFWLFQHAS
jgi:hypothetical protein